MQFVKDFWSDVMWPILQDTFTLISIITLLGWMVFCASITLAGGIKPWETLVGLPVTLGIACDVTMVLMVLSVIANSISSQWQSNSYERMLRHSGNK